MVGPGDRVADKYRLESELSDGPWGRLYIASDDSGDEVVVAVGRQRDPHQFERDVGIASTLRHPVLAAVIDHGIDQGPFIVYRDFGTPLSELVEREGGLPPRRALRLMVQVLQGLEHAHAVGLSHGILHPTSVLVREGDRPTLIGLGLGGKESPRGDVRAAAALLESMLEADSPPTVKDVVAGGRAATGIYATPQGMRRAIEDIRVDIAPPGIDGEGIAHDDRSTTVWPIPEARYDPTRLGRRVIAAMIAVALIAGAAFLWRVMTRAEDLREQREQSPVPSVTTSAETLGLA